MIIKFREDRIAKLEQTLASKNVVLEDKELVDNLRQEIALLKEGNEHSAQSAKLFAEKA